MAAKQKPILYKGMGQPYLALFNFGGMPIMNPITGIPLGAYIDTMKRKKTWLPLLSIRVILIL